jgi:hypothetical protein
MHAMYCEEVRRSRVVRDGCYGEGGGSAAGGVLCSQSADNEKRDQAEDRHPPKS